MKDDFRTYGLGTAVLYFADCAVFCLAAWLQADPVARTLEAVAAACFLVAGTGYMRTWLRDRGYTVGRGR